MPARAVLGVRRHLQRTEEQGAEQPRQQPGQQRQTLVLERRLRTDRRPRAALHLRDRTSRTPSAPRTGTVRTASRVPRDPSIPADLTDPADIQRWIKRGRRVSGSGRRAGSKTTRSHPTNSRCSRASTDRSTSWLASTATKTTPVGGTASTTGPIRCSRPTPTKPRTSLDLDRDGVADFGSCQDFPRQLRLGRGTTNRPPTSSRASVKARGSGRTVPPGNDHIFDRGGGAGSTASTDAVFRQRGIPVERELAGVGRPALGPRTRRR